MSVYDSGVSAYRDTTKWLVAFVPIGSLIAAAVTLGPDLVQSIQSASDVGDWFTSYWLSAVCGLALLIGIGVILIYGARVLSVAPTDIGEIQKASYAPTLAKAIGEGVIAPEFFTPEDFDSAMAALANALDGKDPVADDDPRLTRLRGAIENLRQWSIFNSVQTSFRCFVWAFVVGVAAIGTAITLAPAQLSQGPAIEEPTSVVVEVSGAGETNLEAETGCTGTDNEFTAVDGTWKRPVLAVDGPTCAFGAIWAPTADDAEVRPQPASAT